MLRLACLLSLRSHADASCCTAVGIERDPEDSARRSRHERSPAGGCSRSCGTEGRAILQPGLRRQGTPLPTALPDRPRCCAGHDPTRRGRKDECRVDRRAVRRCRKSDDGKRLGPEGRCQFCAVEGLPAGLCERVPQVAARCEVSSHWSPAIQVGARRSPPSTEVFSMNCARPPRIFCRTPGCADICQISGYRSHTRGSARC